MNTDIIDKFTTHLKDVLTRALTLVTQTNEKTIEPIHLFWALATQKGSIGAEILQKSNIDPKIVDALFKDKNTKLPLGTKMGKISKSELPTPPKLGADSKRAIEKAVLSANLYEHKYVGTEHMLSGLLQIENAVIENFLKKIDASSKDIREQITAVLKSTSKFPELTATLGMGTADSPKNVKSRKMKTRKGQPKTPALDFFGVELTRKDVQAGVDPVIGCETEIERIMQILCRRIKNNPILLGDPGVGKTALIEGLAKKIHEGAVPEALQGKRIFALDMSLVIAGTMYRGEFEGRLKQVIDEIKENPEIILFIDEVHTIMGAGSASGSLDAANILKPALARGDIHCIGATTLAEYKKHIESDAALERRFQTIILEEPSSEKTLKILEGIKDKYENFHGVTITKAAIAAAVSLADRYIQDKFFPDKAIDLIDEAASSLKVRHKGDPIIQKRRELKELLDGIREEKRDAVMREKFIEAISLKEQERQIEDDLSKIDEKIGSKKQKTNGKLVPQHIAEVVSRMTGIPLASLVDDEKKRLLELEAILEKDIIGQAAVIKEVSEYLRRAKTGISHPNRPLASFMFVGPSGVGKTELAKIIANTVFQDKEALVRLDMSEFSEGFSISKLIGAPAGYVGYRDTAKLTDTIKRRPHCVVLFDELEKAHSDVLNLLLQILDEGHITDATGRKINFKNTIIILTSNIGSEKLRESYIGFGSPVGQFSDLNSDIKKSLGDRFKPEFLNRIDRICMFNPLDSEALTKITKLQIQELNKRLENHNITINLEKQLHDWIVKQGTVPEHGARAIRRVIQDRIESQVATLLLENAPRTMRTIKFEVKDDGLVVKDSKK